MKGREPVGQPKMKNWKWHELHKKEFKNVHPIIIMIWNSEQLLKHILRVFPSLGEGKFNSVVVDRSGSQSFISLQQRPRGHFTKLQILTVHAIAC